MDASDLPDRLSVAHHVDQYVSHVPWLAIRVRQQAREIAAELDEMQVDGDAPAWLINASASSLAAATVYAAAMVSPRHETKGVTQRRVATAFDSSTVAIRNHYDQILDATVRADDWHQHDED